MQLLRKFNTESCHCIWMFTTGIIYLLYEVMLREVNGPIVDLGCGGVARSIFLCYLGFKKLLTSSASFTRLEPNKINCNLRSEILIKTPFPSAVGVMCDGSFCN